MHGLACTRIRIHRAESPEPAQILDNYKEDLGNRHTHISIFIVIDCIEFYRTLFFLLFFFLTSFARAKWSDFFNGALSTSAFLSLFPCHYHQLPIPSHPTLSPPPLHFYTQQTDRSVSQDITVLRTKAYNKIWHRLQQQQHALARTYSVNHSLVYSLQVLSYIWGTCIMSASW